MESSRSSISVDPVHEGSGDGAHDGLHSGSEKASNLKQLLDSDSIQDKPLSHANSSDHLRKNETLPQPKIGLKTPITILIPYLLCELNNSLSLIPSCANDKKHC